MGEQLVAVSPKVLKWARTSLGISVSDVSIELKKDTEVIESWENGDSSPTYAQLEHLAYVTYKRPLAIFFMPSPPEEPNVKTEFRTFFGYEGNTLDKDTLLAIRDGKAKQLYLSEFVDNNEASEFVTWLKNLVKTETSLEKIAAIVRARLKVTENEIERSKKTEEALNIWRDAIESEGIFIFKRAFKQKDISGFCLLDERFPLIFLNNKTSFTRQIFTVLHELAHLAFDVSGICSVDTSYITHLKTDDRKIEEWCDKFAAEVLVPKASFLNKMGMGFNENLIEDIASLFRVSPAVIAYKSFDVGLIDREYKNVLMQKYFSDNWRTYKKTGEGKGGGDYYNTQLQYLSRRYTTEAYKKYIAGQLSANSLADYLGIKVSSLSGIENRLMTRG
jgi:Zn-dependent peptidase ImmA (M78 family)